MEESIAEIWGDLKAGKTHYLSGRQKIMLDEFVEKQKESERQYYSRYFKFEIDPDDRERSTYECYCKKTFEEYTKPKSIGVYELVSSKPKEQQFKYVPAEPKSQVDMKLETVLSMIASIEDGMGVSVLSRGGAYGSAKLVIRDVKTGKELERG